MKKNHLLILALSSIMVLAGCGSKTSSSAASSASASSAGASSSATTSSAVPSSPTASSSATPSSSPVASSSKVAEKLATPVISLNAAKTGLTWAVVEHASKYQIKVNTGEYADATDYTFSGDAGTYVVTLKAIGDGISYTDSAEATWNYSTVAISLSELTRTGLNVSWTAVGPTSVAYAADGNITSTAWAATTSTTYVATANGKVGVAVGAGYDETANVNYVGDTIDKYIWCVQDAAANKVLLDSTTDIADDLSVKVYDASASGWVDDSGHVGLSVGIADTEETSDSIDFKIQQLANAYKFGLTMTGFDAYKGISVRVRGDGKSTLVFQMQSAAGYVSYSVGVIGTNWHDIVIPFSDAGWKVNGTSTSLADYALSQGFESAGATLYGFNEFDVIFKTVADAGYAYTHVYVDHVSLIADETGTAAADNQTVVLGSHYTAKNSAGAVFDIQAATTGYTLASLNLAQNLSAPATLTAEGDVVTLKTADNGASLTYVGKATNSGRSIAFTSATGTYASYFTNLNFNFVATIDDFESYTETGVGFDQHNAATARTGLRAYYYSDYYAGSGSDSLSGSGWTLMGSTDYMTLDTTAGDVHSGANCAKVKVGNAMRYTTYGLSDGSAVAWPSANTFSFWAKSPAAIDLVVYVRLYTTNKVSSTNYGVTPTTLTLKAGSSWTQYTVAMDASKTYYGVSFTFEHSSDYSTNYPLLDDLQVYTDANPWAKFVDSSVIANGSVMTGSTTALKSVTATFNVSSSVSIIAVDAASSTHNLTGTYTVDASNNITIDCGSELVYVGVLSADQTAIKYTSATGTLSTYVANLFLMLSVSGKTYIENFENTTTTALESKYTVDRDLNNSGAWTNPTSNVGFIAASEDVAGSGFASGKMAMDTTAAKVGKYRYRFAQTASFGSFANFSIMVKNASSLPITGYLYVCTASGTSASGRTQTSISLTMAAGTDWTTYTGKLSAATAIYGYSFFFTATATTTDVVTGFIYVDNVMAW
jgi:hypothetical protein